MNSLTIAIIFAISASTAIVINGFSIHPRYEDKSWENTRHEHRQNSKNLTTYTAVGTCPERDPAMPVFLPDSEKCDIYYECSGGIPIQKECPPGLEFNPIRNVCDFPIDAGCKAGKTEATVNAIAYAAVGTCPGRDPALPVFLPDSEKCDIYYECSGGLPIQNVCPPDLEFNPVRNVCDFPIDAGCKAGTTETVVKAIAYTAVGTCPERDPAIPVFLPDSEKCDIYYECSGGLPIQKECPPGLEFNPVKNVCDFPIDAGCKAGTTEAVVKAIAYNAVGICPERDPAMPVFLPDSEKCDIYYECSGGIPIQNECPPGLEFNPVRNVCDFPIDAGCKAGTTDAFVKAISYSAVGTCPERDPAMPVFLPDSEKCDIYYECSGGIPIQNECSPGLEFNPVRNVCDFPLDAGCKAGTSETVEK